MGGESSVNYADATTWLERLGISREFTGWDRVVTWISVGWPLAWTLIFAAGTIYNLVVDVPDESWLRFWRGWTWLVLATGLGVTIWFSIGGARDLRYLFGHLRARDNPLEDGRVEDHRIVGER